MRNDRLAVETRLRRQEALHRDENPLTVHAILDEAVLLRQVAFATDMTGVRDSKNPEGPALVFGTPAWASFLAAAHQRSS